MSKFDASKMNRAEVKIDLPQVKKTTVQMVNYVSAATRTAAMTMVAKGGKALFSGISTELMIPDSLVGALMRKATDLVTMPAQIGTISVEDLQTEMLHSLAAGVPDPYVCGSEQLETTPDINVYTKTFAHRAVNKDDRVVLVHDDYKLWFEPQEFNERWKLENGESPFAHLEEAKVKYTVTPSKKIDLTMAIGNGFQYKRKVDIWSVAGYVKGQYSMFADRMTSAKLMLCQSRIPIDTRARTIYLGQRLLAHRVNPTDPWVTVDTLSQDLLLSNERALDIPGTSYANTSGVPIEDLPTGYWAEFRMGGIYVRYWVPY